MAYNQLTIVCAKERSEYYPSRCYTKTSQETKLHLAERFCRFLEYSSKYPNMSEFTWFISYVYAALALHLTG